MQSSQEASQVLGLKKVEKLEQPLPKTPVYSGLSPDGKLVPAQKYPAGDATKVVKGPQIPQKDLFCAQHPTVDFCHSGQQPTPPTPPLPPCMPHCEPPGPCLNNKSLCENGKKDDDKDEHHGPVVIVVPPVRVPVYVPGPVTYSTSPRVVTGVSSAPAARPQPVITPTCMTAADIPALAAGIDELLPKAQLSEADMKQVVEIRQTIQLLATDGKVPAARDAEEIAMNILGYQKVWLRCGQGTFDWEPLPVPTQAQATQAR
jgi:hypothetical protein